MTVTIKPAVDLFDPAYNVTPEQVQECCLAFGGLPWFCTYPDRRPTVDYWRRFENFGDRLRYASHVVKLRSLWTMPEGLR